MIVHKKNVSTMRQTFTKSYSILLLLISSLWSVPAYCTDIETLDRLLASKNINVQALKSMGPAIMPNLVTLYKKGNSTRRATIAWVWYKLAWKSPAAREAMLADMDTTHKTLRLQIQWAIGHVSNDTEVVHILLDKLMNDPNPLFSEKAACALASDQIHLNDFQRVELLDGLISGMESDSPQVRDFSIRAMQIQTGQRKQYNANAPAGERAQQVRIWRQWLNEYKSNL